MSAQRQRLVESERKLVRNWKPTASNQLWATDIKYGYIDGESRFFQVASIIDVFDRSIVGYYMGVACPSKSVLEVLEKARKTRGLKGAGLVLRSDNGPQFRSHLMRAGCEKIGVAQEFIPFKTPNANAHIESFHSILERECLADSKFMTYWDTYQAIETCMELYNARRLHSACSYCPPDEYCRANQNKDAICTVAGGPKATGIRS